MLFTTLNNKMKSSSLWALTYSDGRSPAAHNSVDAMHGSRSQWKPVIIDTAFQADMGFTEREALDGHAIQALGSDSDPRRGVNGRCSPRRRPPSTSTRSQSTDACPTLRRRVREYRRSRLPHGPCSSPKRRRCCTGSTPVRPQSSTGYSPAARPRTRDSEERLP